MKKLLVIALILVAANAFAQTDPKTNGIGIYFDELGINNGLASAPPYTMVNAYLLATRISQVGGLSGWEAEVAVIPAPAVAPSYLLNNNGLNVLTAPVFQVGMAVAMPQAAAMKLLTISVLNFGTPFTLAVGPCTPSSFEGKFPGYADGVNPGILVGLTPSCSVPVPGRTNFFTVAGFMTTPPVAVENDSWGSVKNLYQ